MASNVHSSNRFLFATTGHSLNSLEASSEFDRFKVEAKVNSNITGYDFRHYIVSEFYNLSKSVEERKYLALHMGHSMEMQRDRYSGLGSKKMVLAIGDDLMQIKEDLLNEGKFTLSVL